MVKVVRVLVLPLALLLSLLTAPAANAAARTPLPNSMAALGDSITQADDVAFWYGDHPANSWSTGNSPSDGVTSQYERLVVLNSRIRGNEYNDAVSGAKASGLTAQVSKAVEQKPDYVTLLIGANDLCTSSLSTMTSTARFTSQVDAALAALHMGLPAGATIFVSSIPNIYQLRSVLQGNWVARFVWSTAGICGSLDACVFKHRGKASAGGSTGDGVQPDPEGGLCADPTMSLGCLRDIQLQVLRRTDQHAGLLPPESEWTGCAGAGDLECLVVGRLT